MVALSLIKIKNLFQMFLSRNTLNHLTNWFILSLIDILAVVLEASLLGKNLQLMIATIEYFLIREI